MWVWPNNAGLVEGSTLTFAWQAEALLSASRRSLGGCSQLPPPPPTLQAIDTCIVPSAQCTTENEEEQQNKTKKDCSMADWCQRKPPRLQITMVITETKKVKSEPLSPGRGTHSKHLYWFLPSPQSAGSDEDDDQKNKKVKKTRDKLFQRISWRRGRKGTSLQNPERGIERVWVCPLDNIERDWEREKERMSPSPSAHWLSEDFAERERERERDG